MCLVCISTAALIVGSVASSGGLGAAAMRKFGGKNVGDNHSESALTKEDRHG
jgi:hypothetical protein